MPRGGLKKATSPAAPLIKDPARYKVCARRAALRVRCVLSSGGTRRHSTALLGLLQTELCATFARANSCPYGHKCQFAHGVEELRTRQVTRRPVDAWRSSCCQRCSLLLLLFSGSPCGPGTSRLRL